MSILLITHDLGVVAENADVVYGGGCMRGKIVEYADVYELFENPLHPYTRGLLACVPKLGHEGERLFTIPGMVPAATKYPSGCRFAARCTECQGAVRMAKEIGRRSRMLRGEAGALGWRLGDAPGICTAAVATEPRLDFRRERVTV